MSSYVTLSKKSNIANMIVTKPICIGVASWAAAHMIEGQVASQPVDLFGVQMSLGVFYGLLGAGSSLLTNPITDIAMKNLSSKYANLSRELVSNGVHVVAGTGALMLLDKQHNFRKEAIAVNVLGGVIGTYVDNLIAPMFGVAK